MVTLAQVRRGLAEHGKCQPQNSKAWKGTIPLPDAIAEFYENVGPINISIDQPGDAFFLPRLSRLWTFQEGYRWNASTEEPDDEWDPDWIVVATHGSDPFIFHQSEEQILFARHGSGTWEPIAVYPDLLSMAACMATLGSIAARAGDDLLNDAMDVRPKYRQEAKHVVGEILPKPRHANVVLACAGWL